MTGERDCLTSTGLIILTTLLLRAASTVDASSGHLNGQVSSHSLPILRNLSPSLSVFLLPMRQGRTSGHFSFYILLILFFFFNMFLVFNLGIWIDFST